MKERPILFSAPMVRAILEGIKTQTRRVITQKNNPHDFIGGIGDSKNDPHNYGFENPEVMGHFITLPEQRCPHGCIGDYLWVRETFAWLPSGMNADPKDGYYVYRADAPMNVKWKPSIHMPRWVSRINLEITDVRIERLQDISEDDAMLEGVIGNKERHIWKDYKDVGGYHDTAKESFISLWTFINGDESWKANPWVWVIEFERITK